MSLEANTLTITPPVKASHVTRGEHVNHYTTIQELVMSLEAIALTITPPVNS